MSRNTLIDCTQQQRESATRLDKPVLVLSGAGTGKTYAAVMRCAHLVLDQRVSHEEILVLVNSQRMVSELGRRLETVMGNVPAPTVDTYQSFCCRVLRDEAESVGYSRDFIVYDEGDRHGLIRSILKEFNIHEALFRGTASRISLLKAAMIDPEAFVAEGGGYGFEEKLAQVYMRYQSELRKNNAMDHDDLVMLTVRLLEEEKSLAKKVSRRVRHLVVDDFQDATPAQYALVQMIAKESVSVFIAADDDQAILGYRGGAEHLTGLNKDFKGARSFRFDGSHRCTSVILEAAASVIRCNAGRTEKRLSSLRPNGAKPECFHAGTEIDEAVHIARNIRELYLTGQYGLGDFVILYRLHSQIRPLEEALRAESLPYYVSAAYPFFQRPEIRDALAHARVAVNPRDAYNLKRILLSSPWSLTEAAVAKLMASARAEDLDFHEYLVKGIKVRKNLARLKPLLDALQKSNPARRDGGEAIDIILSKSGYQAALEEAEDGVQKRSGLDKLKEMAKGWSLRAFLDHVSFSYEGEATRSGDVVSLMTLHEAQGLEFPVVFLAGLEEGILPHQHACKESGVALEEERRLLYVGMTRARDLLYLSCAGQRKLYTRFQSQEPSRFLKDVPESCCATVRRIPADTRVRETAPPRRSAFRLEMPYPIGARVKHIRWGAGIVRDYVGQGEEAKVTVNFPGHGVKRLAVKFANLEVI